MAEKEGSGLWAHIATLWQAVCSPFSQLATRLDPVAAAAGSPEIRAAARSWRQKLSSASVRKRRLLDTSVVLRESISASELDAFEEALVMEFARAKVYCPDSTLWTKTGMEVWMHLHCAAREAGFVGKVDDFGYLSRMRILPEQVDHEVGKDFSDYNKGNWENVWTAGKAT